MTGSLVGYGGITPPSTSIYVEHKSWAAGLWFRCHWSGRREVRFRSQFLPWTWSLSGELSSKMGDSSFGILLVGNLLSAIIMRRRRWPAESLARSRGIRSVSNDIAYRTSSVQTNNIVKLRGRSLSPASITVSIDTRKYLPQAVPRSTFDPL